MTNKPHPFQQFLKLFELQDYEVPLFRLWALVLATSFPMFGFFLLGYTDYAIDYMTHRWLISLFWFMVLAISYISPAFRKHLGLPTLIGNLMCAWWVVWVVAQNDFSSEYCIAMFLGIAGIIAINRTILELVIYYFYTIGFALYYFYINDAEVLTSKEIIILGFVTLFMFHILVIGAKNYITRSLKQLNQKLLFKNNRLKQLVFVSSHDLKTPLRNIGSCASLLKMEMKEGVVLAEEDIETYLDIILRGAVNMDEKLNDLLDYFKFDDTETEYTMIPFQEVTQQLTRSILRKYPETDIQIRISPETPKTIRGNKVQLEYLLFHLLENGIKYNHSKKKVVEVRYENTSKYHIFIIKDNGIGMKMKHKDKIFSLFQRLHKPEEFSGTGAGLAICKIIVENHKGRIWLANSQPNKGSDFRFQIPKQLW